MTTPPFDPDDPIGIDDLFLAGILPGLLAIGLYAVTVQVLVWRNPAAGPRGARAAPRRVRRRRNPG